MCTCMHACMLTGMNIYTQMYTHMNECVTLTYFENEFSLDVYEYIMTKTRVSKDLKPMKKTFFNILNKIFTLKLCGCLITVFLSSQDDPWLLEFTSLQFNFSYNLHKVKWNLWHKIWKSKGRQQQKKMDCRKHTVSMNQVHVSKNSYDQTTNFCKDQKTVSKQ